MNLQDFTDTYRQNFSAIGGNPDACEGVVWTEGYLKSNPNATISDFVRMVEQKINEGSADHGWLLSSLQLNWTSLSETERLAYLEVLSRGGAHKALLNASLFKEKFTVREADAFEQSLRRTRAIKAADRFKRERASRVLEARHA